MPTPRESTPVEPSPRQNTHTHKLLHDVGKKLAATAASASAPPPPTKRKRPESPLAAAVSTYKRRKTFTSVPLPAAHPRELIRKGWSRSGRKHLPSAKAREIAPTQAQKRPRGRPRLHPLPTSSARPTPSPSESPSPVTTAATASAPPALLTVTSASPISFALRTAKSRAVDDQPRETNGRFGKKASTNGKFRRRIGPTPVLHRTRAQRAEGRANAQREVADSGSESSGHDLVTAVKRERDDEYEYEYEHEHEHEPVVDTDGPSGGPKRPRVPSYAYPTQYFTPNPMSFARKKWAPAQSLPRLTHHLRSLGAVSYSDQDMLAARPPASSSGLTPHVSSQLSPPPPPSLAESEDVEDESDGGGSDDGDWPVTPDNVPGPEPETQQDRDAGLESDNNELQPSGGSAKHSLPTLWKPSPFVYAARRWALQNGGGTLHEPDQERSHFFPMGQGTGTGASVSVGVSDATNTSGVGACGGGSGSGVARTEWMQVNGTTAQFRKWDTYEVDSASSSEEEDVVVVKSPDPTKFKLANALFPGMPAQPPSTMSEVGKKSSGDSKSNTVVVQAELAAVELASSTPSPAWSEGSATVGPLVVLKGTQFGISGPTSKYSSLTPVAPGLVAAGWDSELSAEA
ncbi:hypothetical protein B0F90DRAFT_1700801 [Multifurca ochricompacta]|uniref:Uncharacterized protein n=1 Tax=Multifurca ochricompacta TaxID=376703 RepID=A0AAD4M958_9AGAM|nr:hypothetical protein B0F90DRAFT_1700801 [Multifurca ochricompacta]